MPTMVLGDDPAHNVTILDVAGKPIEWNGDVRQYCRYLAYLLNFLFFLGLRGCRVGGRDCRQRQQGRTEGLRSVFGQWVHSIVNCA